MKNKKRKKKITKIQKKLAKLRSVESDSEKAGFPAEILATLERSLNLAMAAESALDDSAKSLLVAKRNNTKAFGDLKGAYKNIKKELKRLRKRSGKQSQEGA